MSETVTLRAANPYDFTAAELDELASQIQLSTPGLDVRIADRSERGYGVNRGETIDLLLDPGLKSVVTVLVTLALQTTVGWAKKRWKHEKDEHPELPPRPRTVRVLYGPDGKVLTQITIDLPDGDPQDTDPE